MPLDVAGSSRRTRRRIIFFASLCAGFMITLGYRVHQEGVRQASLAASATGPNFDPGVAAARPHAKSTPTSAAASPASDPADDNAWTPANNTAKPSEAASSGMVCTQRARRQAFPRQVKRRGTHRTSTNVRSGPCVPL